MTPDLLKITLSLILLLDHRGDLDTGIHHFCLRQYMSASRNFLKDHSNQPQVISVGGGIGHPSAHIIDTFYKSIMERDLELGGYLMQDQGLNSNIPAVLTL